MPKIKTIEIAGQPCKKPGRHIGAFELRQNNPNGPDLICWKSPRKTGNPTIAYADVLKVSITFAGLLIQVLDRPPQGLHRVLTVRLWDFQVRDPDGKGHRT